MTFRFGRCALILAVTCVLAGSSAASVGAAPRNFNFTRTFETFVTQTPHITLVPLVGTAGEPLETSIPRVGRALVSGELVSSGGSSAHCPPTEEGCPPPVESTFRLEIRAKRGTLVLSGGSPDRWWSPPFSGSWSVVEATGRFAGYVGTGSFTVTMTTPYRATLSITGRLRNAG